MRSDSEKKVISINHKVYYPLAFVLVFLLVLFTLSAADIYTEPAQYGHSGDEVEGAWETSGGDYYTLNNVGIGTLDTASRLNIRGDLKFTHLTGVGSGIIFSDGKIQARPYIGSFSCPPRVFGINTGSDDDENMLYDDCQRIAPNVVKITNPIVCENNFGDCGVFMGRDERNPNGGYIAIPGRNGYYASEVADFLCKQLGYKESLPIEETVSVPLEGTFNMYGYDPVLIGSEYRRRPVIISDRRSYNFVLKEAKCYVN